MRSLKTRAMLFTLAVLFLSMWSLSFFAMRELRVDMQNLLGKQQFAMASMVAAKVNQGLEIRLGGLELVARAISEEILSDTEKLQAFMVERIGLCELFNGGLIVLNADNAPLARFPVQAGEYDDFDMSAFSAVLTEGKVQIGRPFMNSLPAAPTFIMAAPIRDPRGRVIGALAGVTHLGMQNFLDKIFDTPNGLSGGYLVLVAPQHRLIISATDKQRRMEVLPAVGRNGLIDRFVQGYEGSGVMVNPQGVEVLVSNKNVPVAGWQVGVALATDKAFTPVRDMQQRVLMATILLTLVAGFLTWWLLRRQLEPILVATRALAHQTQTNQPLQPLPDNHSQDEIGQLISGFNRLLETLMQREEALRESEARLQATLDAVPDRLFEVGLDGLYHASHFSPADLLLAPPPENALIGMHVTDVLPGEAAAITLAALQEAHVSGYSGGKQYVLNLPHGRRWFELSVACKATPAGEVPRFIVLAHDISQRKHAEEQLLTMTENLEEQVSIRTMQLRKITAQLTMTEERERCLLAQELHDNLGQILAAIKIKLNTLATRSKTLHAAIGNIAKLVDDAHQSVRQVTQQWSPPHLKVLGFERALEWLGEDIMRLYGIAVHADIKTCKHWVSAETESLLFRSVRELLINVAKHAGVDAADLSVCCDGEQMRIVVRDTGCGFDPQQVLSEVRERLSFGLHSINERMQTLDGAMAIDSSPGKGTTVTLLLPCTVITTLGSAP